MASKKSRPLDDPPDASSSEEVESSEEEAEQEEQEVVGSKPQSNKESNSKADESDEESQDSDEQQTEKKNEEKPKPISPVKDGTGTGTGTGNSKPDTPVSKPAEKRGAENGKSPSKAKKAKTETVEDEEDGGGVSLTGEKKSAVNRLWTEEDEISMLKGLLEFESKFGKDVSTHYQEFLDFVKGSLSVVDLTKDKLSDKVRRLKRKFKTNCERSNNGDDPSFSKPHELKAFQLCKKIWGNGNAGNVIDDNNTRGNEKDKASRRKSKPVEKDLVKGKSETVETDDLGKLYACLICSCNRGHMSNLSVPEFLKSNLSLVGSSQLKDLDDKWKRQNAAEMEVYLGRIDLLREEARMVLDAVKKNNN